MKTVTRYKKQLCDECGLRVLIDTKNETSTAVRGEERYCLPLNCAKCDTVIGMFCDDCLIDLHGWLCEDCEGAK